MLVVAYRFDVGLCADFVRVLVGFDLGYSVCGCCFDVVWV